MRNLHTAQQLHESLSSARARVYADVLVGDEPLLQRTRRGEAGAAEQKEAAQARWYRKNQNVFAGGSMYVSKPRVQEMPSRKNSIMLPL